MDIYLLIPFVAIIIMIVYTIWKKNKLSSTSRKKSKSWTDNISLLIKKMKNGSS